MLGTDHPETLRTRGNLATAYVDAGRVAKAITSLEQTLDDMERVLGANHPNTLAMRRNLVIAYLAALRTAKAIEPQPFDP